MKESEKHDQSTDVEVASKLIVTLSNGLRVANFSSPHSFMFEDGTSLPARNERTAKRLLLHFIESEVRYIRNGIEYANVVIKWMMSPEIKNEIAIWQSIYDFDGVDIVIVPLPVLQVIKEEYDDNIHYTPFRVIRVKDRITKTIHIDKYCV